MPPEESYSLTFLATLLWGTKELTELRKAWIAYLCYTKFTCFVRVFTKMSLTLNRFRETFSETRSLLLNIEKLYKALNPMDPRPKL